MKSFLGIAVIIIPVTILSMGNGPSSEKGVEETSSDLKLSTVVPHLSGSDVAIAAENFSNYLKTAKLPAQIVKGLLPQIIDTLSARFKQNPLIIALYLNKAGIPEAKEWLDDRRDELKKFIVSSYGVTAEFPLIELIRAYNKHGSFFDSDFIANAVKSGSPALLKLLLKSLTEMAFVSPVKRNGRSFPAVSSIWEEDARNRELKIGMLAEALGLGSLIQFYQEYDSKVKEPFTPEILNALKPYLRKHPNSLVYLVRLLKTIPKELQDSEIMNARDENGQNVLMFFITMSLLLPDLLPILHKELPVLTSLVNVNVQDNNGLTALMLATAFGDLDTVKYLMEKAHADATIAEKHGFTALTYANELPKASPEIKNYLTKHVSQSEQKSVKV